MIWGKEADKHIINLVGLFLFSTNSAAQTDSKENITGTFGESFLHQLTLNKKQTFHYIRVLGDKKTDDTGSWSIIDEEITLTDSTNNSKLLTRWKVKKTTRGLKSKNGFATYTLCKNRE